MHFYSRRDLCMHINCSCGNSLSYSFFSRDVQPAVATGLDNHIRRDKGTGMTDQASNKHIFTCFLVIMYKRRGTESLLPGQWSSMSFWPSSWPWYLMQTTMLQQRSVITLIEWRWQVASALPVDGNPMLCCLNSLFHTAQTFHSG